MSLAVSKMMRIMEMMVMLLLLGRSLETEGFKGSYSYEMEETEPPPTPPTTQAPPPPNPPTAHPPPPANEHTDMNTTNTNITQETAMTPPPHHSDNTNNTTQETPITPRGYIYTDWSTTPDDTVQVKLVAVPNKKISHSIQPMLTVTVKKPCEC
ncbi:hypothetical protein Pmani_009328 [Petrolisthes manimaculis]|uniref:Uncharacterized protein n=1 Tax=Petrolisthes manimaculis TaxID=1843537 RepID=A0AAE1PZF5_9EUCA|nr:hypothetical protein Pmani_011517 [Petrolisthes manimaculis]KAK4319763.1 hypothetical protein Pmani_009328 [Petrolisthes manimaculis]